MSQQRISLIEAGAGTAKTTTLALRVGEALARGLAPEEILIWVFTDEAAAVFKERLRALGVAKHLVRRLRIDTVERFAQSVWSELETREVPVYGSLAELQAPILQALEQCSVRYGERYPYLEIRSHAAALSQFFMTQLRLKLRLSLLDEEASLSPEERAELLQVPLSEYLWTLSYERVRLSAFGEALFRGPFDASYDLARELSLYPDRAQWLPCFKLIIVDELHDMNATAFAILRALLQVEHAYLVAAGDSDQVIYSHMGADKRYLHEHFQMFFAEVSRYQLGRSYRYGPWLALSMGVFKHKKIESGLARETPIELCFYEQNQQSEQLLRAVIARGGKEKDKAGQCAVIMRAQHQSVLLENALLMEQVPYQCVGFVPYLKRDEILFIRGLLVIALQSFNDLSARTLEGMVRALSIFGEAQLGLDEIAKVQQEIVQEPTILRYFYEVRLLEYSSEASGRRNRAAIELIQSFGADAPAAPMLDALYACLDIQALARRIYLETEQAQIITESILGLRHFAQQQKCTIMQLHQWLTQADSLAEHGAFYVPEGHRGQRSAGRVTLLCAAQAKGTEFDHVFVPFLAQGEFPRVQQPSINEENLFYVACTRAKQSLTLFMPKEVHLRSPFVERMHITEVQAAAQQHLYWMAQRQERLQRAARAPQAQGQIERTKERSAPVSQRIYLQVPYVEKDEAKALGARWDPQRRLWYVPAGVAAAPLLQRWPRSH